MSTVTTSLRVSPLKISALITKLCLLLSAPCIVAAVALGQSGPVIKLPAGSVRGVAAFRTQAFLGIPFAAPPIGPLRWAAPAPVAQWQGIRDATHVAAACPQIPNGDGPGSTDEDCLYLNIYRPSDALPSSKLPVMVFFHGGGNIAGATGIYDGRRMAEVGHAIVVLPAYRLGIFGLLALPELGPDAGTYLLQDQIAALRWVRANIAAFGGNPADVTLSGESSGAMDTCDLLASPAAAGLFQRVIMQSGFCMSGPSLAVAQKQAQMAASKAGCAGSQVLACMRNKSAAEILSAGDNRLMDLAGPANGGRFLPVSAEEAVRTGKFNKVPVLLGFNRDELWPFQHNLYPLSEEKYQQILTNRYKALAPEVAKLYPSANSPHREYALGALAGDSLMVCPILQDAAMFSRTTPVSVYEFADRTVPPFKSLGPDLPRPPGYHPGAFHTAELQYLYNYQAAEGPLSFQQRSLGDHMIANWVGFGRAAGIWPSFQPEAPDVLQLGADGASFRVETSGVAGEHHCDFWDAVPGAR